MGCVSVLIIRQWASQIKTMTRLRALWAAIGGRESGSRTGDWVVQPVHDDFQSLGYPEANLRADTEPATKVAFGNVKGLRGYCGGGRTDDVGEKAGQRTKPDDATAGQPQTNGVAEKVAEDVTTHARKYKIAFET